MVSFLAMTALILTGCPDDKDTSSDNKSKDSYIAITSININPASAAIEEDQIITLTAQVNSGVHNSLSITWTSSNTNAVKFVVNNNEVDYASGNSVVIKGISAASTPVTITASASTVNPDDKQPTIKNATSSITVKEKTIIEQKKSIEWRFDYALAQSLELPPATTANYFDILKETSLGKNELEGDFEIEAFLTPITSPELLQIRNITTSGMAGYLQATIGPVSWGKVTGIPNGARIAFTFEFNDTGSSGNRGTDRFPIITVGGTEYRGTVYASGQQSTWYTDTITITGNGGDIIIGNKDGIRISRMKIESIALTGLKLETDREEIFVNHEAVLTVTKTPAEAIEELEWIYDNEYFELTNNEDGTARIKGLKATSGVMPIRIQAKNNPSIYDTTDITVNPVTGEEKFVEEIFITGGDFELVLGGDVNLSTKQLIWTFEPAEPDDDELEWSSDKIEIATVTPEGLVTAISPGTAIITANAKDGGGASTSVSVTVKQLTTSLAMGNTNKFWMNVNGTLIIHADTVGALPANATNRTVTWSSGNTVVAEVHETTGLITAKAKGNAVITATTTDGSNISANVTVQVIDFTDEYGTEDKHWKFSDAPTTGLTWDANNSRYTISNSNTITYNGMTIYGDRVNNMSLSLIQHIAAGSDHGLFTAGCLNGGNSTGNNYLVIDNLQGPFKLVVLYNGGGNSNRGRSLNIATAAAGTMGQNNGTVQVTGAAAFGSTFGLTPTLIEYKYEGTDKLDVGFRQISGGVRIHDVYIYFPVIEEIIISAEGNKTSISAGVTDGAAAETLQFTAIQNRDDVTTSVNWYLLEDDVITSDTIDTDIAIIPGGLLTAGVDLEDDAEVWVFAEKDGQWSEGIMITIKKWEEPVIPTGPALYKKAIGGTNVTTTSFADGKLSVTGTGNFGNGAQNGNFVYTPISSATDFIATVKIHSYNGNNNDNSRAALVIFDINPVNGIPATNNVPYVAVGLRGSGTQFYDFFRAPTAPGTAASGNAAANAFGPANIATLPLANPVWLRIEKTGTNYTVSISTNGIDFTARTARAGGNFGSILYVGLTSSSNTGNGTAVYSDFTINYKDGNGAITVDLSQNLD